MHILAKLSPNNKLQIKRYRVADGYRRPKKSDDSVALNNILRDGKNFEELLSRYRILQANSKIVEQTYYTEQVYQGQLDLFENRSKKVSLEKGSAVSTSLPCSLKYACISKDGGVFVENEDYREFQRRSMGLLDLLKKSQQPLKRHISWGKPQRPKLFRYQAGEKIKEGGAIIDRFCGKNNSSMLTLTLPGSSWYAMDAVARWSGWIINRMMQVIRRIPKSCPPVFWFFVWEHQKRGALHLHFCLGWKVHWAKRELLAYRLKDAFYKCLLELKEKDDVDCFQRKGFSISWRFQPWTWKWDYQEINKSVAAYFAKYCQKNAEYNGDNGEKPDRNDGRNRRRSRKVTSKKGISYPSRYWGSSQSIKRWCKTLSVSESYCASSREETLAICSRIRRLAVENEEVLSVSVSPFQIIDPKTSICISSGEVETYRFDPDDYPRIWKKIVSEVFERDICMDANMKEFLGVK